MQYLNPLNLNPDPTDICKYYLPVCYVLGGVARNIAECMSKFGKKPFMISAVGFDVAGNLLLEHWKSAGLSMEG